MTTGAWVLLLTCASFIALSIAVWWMERKKKNKWDVRRFRRTTYNRWHEDK